MQAEILAMIQARLLNRVITETLLILSLSTVVSGCCACQSFELTFVPDDLQEAKQVDIILCSERDDYGRIQGLSTADWFDKDEDGNSGRDKNKEYFGDRLLSLTVTPGDPPKIICGGRGCVSEIGIFARLPKVGEPKDYPERSVVRGVLEGKQLTWRRGNDLAGEPFKPKRRFWRRCSLTVRVSEDGIDLVVYRP